MVVLIKGGANTISSNPSASHTIEGGQGVSTADMNPGATTVSPESEYLTPAQAKDQAIRGNQKVKVSGYEAMPNDPELSSLKENKGASLDPEKAFFEAKEKLLDLMEKKGLKDFSYLFLQSSNTQSSNEQQFKIIGSGEFGQVFKFEENNTSYVLKAPKQKAEEETPFTFEERLALIQESIVHLELPDSEHLVKLKGYINIEVGDVATPCPVLEFCSRGSLFDIISGKERMKLSTKSTLQIILGFLNGLECMHAKDYIHRDIAARNILVDKKKGGESKEEELIGKGSDFGMTRKVVNNGIFLENEKNRPVAVRWAAPEVVFKKTSKASDVWSVGAMIIEALSGNHPCNNLKENGDVLAKYTGYYKEGGEWKVNAELMDESFNPLSSLLKEKEDFFQHLGLNTAMQGVLKGVLEQCFNRVEDQRPNVRNLIDQITRIINSMEGE